MKFLNKKGLDKKRASKEKLNNQRIKSQKTIKEIYINNYEKNKKFTDSNENIKETKGIRKKNYKTIRGNDNIKHYNEKNIEKYSNFIYTNLSYLTINYIIIIINLNNLKMQLINAENFIRQIYSGADRLRKFQKQKQKNNIIENNNEFRIYISFILFKPIIIKILNIMKKNFYIIKLPLNNNKIFINEKKMKYNNNYLQLIIYSNYSSEKTSIHNTIQINRRNIFIIGFSSSIYINKLYISESNINLYYELYFPKYKNNYIYNKNSNYEYFDSLINNKKIVNQIFYIITDTNFLDETLIYQKFFQQQILLFNKKIILNSIIGIIIIFIHLQIFKEKSKTINCLQKRKNNIKYNMRKIRFFGIKIESHITLNLNGQQKIKNDERKIEEIPEKNRKNSILNNYKINNNSIINLIILFKIIILINIFSITENKIFNLFFFQTSKIILKVKGIGEKKIFGNYFGSNIDSIYINSIRQDQFFQQHYLNQSENLVEIIFKDKTNLNSLSFMFAWCIDITEIDLSNFDTSSVNNMDFMFLGCTLLTSINLTNFITSSVTSMNQIFSKCSSLKSLDLSYFIVSSVTNMGMMFSECSSLTYINLTNFICFQNVHH